MTTTATADARAISPRRSAALVAALLGLVLLAWPAGVSAAGQPLRPQEGLLSQAFVEALHNPLAGAFGKLPNPVKVHLGAAAKARAARLSVAYPAYDLRTLGRLTAVKDQGSYGTCWAFANLAALESRLLPSQPRDFSEDNLVTRSGYGPFEHSGPYNWGGWDFMAVAYLTRWAGPVYERDDRYGTRTPPPTTTARKHVQGVIMLPGRTGFLDNGLLKQMVVDNGALSVGMYYDDSFYWFDSRSADSTATATYYADVAAGETFNHATVAENHGVCIVGWDDTFSATQFAGSSAGVPPGDGAFLVRNSWGAGWGDQGYFWVSYYDRSFAFDDCTSYTRVESPRNYTRNYQYDKLGWTTSWGYPSAADPSVAWAANRFTARASEQVVAAGFYAPVGGTLYEVWTGARLGTLRRRGSGTVALPGFVTVDLGKPLAVRAGKKFVIALRLVTPGVTHPIAVERPMAQWESRAVAGAGQSYMRYGDGDAWFDLANDRMNPNANVCLKAYARL